LTGDKLAGLALLWLYGRILPFMQVYYRMLLLHSLILLFTHFGLSNQQTHYAGQTFQKPGFYWPVTATNTR